jgi:ABC-type transport system involved in multi-copper enzyme maturation permease subunit
MLKLIKLEIKKLRIAGWLRNIFIANILLTLWVIISVPNEQIDTYEMALSSVGSYVRITFIIFSSVLMARMVIDEYRNKTITVLFTYPIKRKKLLIAKLFLVSLLTFFVVLFSNSLVAAIFLIMDAYHHYLPQTLTTEMIFSEAARIVIFAVGFMGLSLFPFIVGMFRKSVPATIITSFVVSIGFSGTNLGNHWIGGSAVALAIVGLGCFTSYLAIRKIEHIDVL